MNYFKCRSLENVVREKSWQETMYSSKISSTEKVLEQTYSLLNNLQIEVSSMTNDVESAQLKDEAYYRGLFLDLSNKVCTTTFLFLIKEVSNHLFF